MEVQIFGVKKSSDTRKALRFFAERRIKTHFVDLNERAASLGELKRFVQKFGLDQFIDRDSKRYAELGLQHAAAHRRALAREAGRRTAPAPRAARAPWKRADGRSRRAGLEELDEYVTQLAASASA